MPEVRASHEKRTIHSGGELLDATEKAVSQDHLRRRLDDSNRAILFHQLHQSDHGGPGHDTVGVQHNHVAVVGSPTPAKVSHVPTLVIQLDPALAIKDACEPFDPPAKFQPAFLFFNPVIRISRIAQDKEVESVSAPGLLQRFKHKPDALKDAADLFVIDRHDDGRARQRSRPRLLRQGASNPKRIALSAQDPKTDKREGQTKRHLREQDRVQDQDEFA